LRPAALSGFSGYLTSQPETIASRKRYFLGFFVLAFALSFTVINAIGGLFLVGIVIYDLVQNWAMFGLFHY
jgi:hypothetical protein